jgi:hypothetical protein
MGGVMVCILDLSYVCCYLWAWVLIAKTRAVDTTGICCFSAEHAALRSKSKDRSGFVSGSLWVRAPIAKTSRYN